jgi:hypothetical protein
MIPKSLRSETGIGITKDLRLRVSVATLNQVVFPHPRNETLMLALERKATVLRDEENNIHVCAQPFGGVVNILNPFPLQEIVGEIQFDSKESKQEQDFRILIPTSRWEEVKKYCLHHLENPDDAELESTPHRELVEEFEETLKVNLKPEQYIYQPFGFVIENDPVSTDNVYVQGQLTVRLYRIFEVHILDNALCKTMLSVSQRHSNQELSRLALKDFQNGGNGRANSILTLPLSLIVESCLAIPSDERYQKIVVENHELDESVMAILKDVSVPQYQRI